MAEGEISPNDKKLYSLINLNPGHSDYKFTATSTIGYTASASGIPFISFYTDSVNQSHKRNDMRLAAEMTRWEQGA